MIKRHKNKLLLALSVVGPGLFLIGYNIGTGSITTMAKTGAEHGMRLFWALVLSCVFTFILMVAYGKVTLVTGKTALFNIKHDLPECVDHLPEKLSAICPQNRLLLNTFMMCRDLN